MEDEGIGYGQRVAQVYIYSIIVNRHYFLYKSTGPAVCMNQCLVFHFVSSSTLIYALSLCWCGKFPDVGRIVTWDVW